MSYCRTRLGFVGLFRDPRAISRPSLDVQVGNCQVDTPT